AGRQRRSTPTRVGTLQIRAGEGKPEPVHPHTRGDIGSFAGSFILGDGPPPHAWGHLPCAAEELERWRSTPTRVGTFGPGYGAQSPGTVHPHTRGDICCRSSISRFPFGPPPH